MTLLQSARAAATATTCSDFGDVESDLRDSRQCQGYSDELSASLQRRAIEMDSISVSRP